MPVENNTVNVVDSPESASIVPVYTNRAGSGKRPSLECCEYRFQQRSYSFSVSQRSGCVPCGVSTKGGTSNTATVLKSTASAFGVETPIVRSFALSNSERIYDRQYLLSLLLILVSRNVCDLGSPPRIVKPEIQPLTMEQAHKLLEAAHGHRLMVLLMVALTTGMRRGELLRLKWVDIDFENHFLQVRRTLDFLAGYGGYVETEPKTAKGRRKIMLPDFVMEALKQHRVQQLECRLKDGTDWQEQDYVFTGLKGGPLNPRYILKLFDKLLKEAGLPHMRFHDLRHSAATLLLRMGVNAKVVQEILGHSNISMTMDVYSHVLPSMHKDAMGKWDDEFGVN